MRRNALTRLTTLLHAVWLVLALGAQTARPCPTHDGASLVGTHAGTHAAMAGMAMAGMDMEPDGAQSPAHGSQHGEMHHTCTCVGCCCVTAFDLGSVPTARVPASRIVAASLDAPTAACLTPVSRTARLLPFANGPPAASSITA
jgi:hypothetical protein